MARREVDRHIRADKSLTLMSSLSALLKNDDPFGLLILLTVKALVLLHSYAPASEIGFILEENVFTIERRAQGMIDQGYLTTNSSTMYAVTKEGHALLDSLSGHRALIYAKISDKKSLKNEMK